MQVNESMSVNGIPNTCTVRHWTHHIYRYILEGIFYPQIFLKEVPSLKQKLIFYNCWDKNYSGQFLPDRLNHSKYCITKLVFQNSCKTFAGLTLFTRVVKMVWLSQKIYLQAHPDNNVTNWGITLFRVLFAFYNFALFVHRAFFKNHEKVIWKIEKVLINNSNFWGILWLTSYKKVF